MLSARGGRPNVANNLQNILDGGMLLKFKGILNFVNNYLKDRGLGDYVDYKSKDGLIRSTGLTGLVRTGIGGSASQFQVQIHPPLSYIITGRKAGNRPPVSEIDKWLKNRLTGKNSSRWIWKDNGLKRQDKLYWKTRSTGIHPASYSIASSIMENGTKPYRRGIFKDPRFNFFNLNNDSVKKRLTVDIRKELKAYFSL